MDVHYTAPKIVDYGDIAQITAAQQNRSQADMTIPAGATLGNGNSSGICKTGFENVGGICVPIAPGSPF
jgi:hypothetical protein